MQATDPRKHWSKLDWTIATAYFLMMARTPPGKQYAPLYAYCYHTSQ